MNRHFRSDRILRHEERKSASSRIIQMIIIWIFACIIFLYFLVKNTGNIEITPKGYIIDKWASMLSLNTKLKWWVADWRYSLWVRYFAPENITLMAWEYEAVRGTTVETFFTESIASPVHTDITITILPGWNMYDIDAYLVEKNIAKTGEFLRVASDRFAEYQTKYDWLTGVDSLEGFLYPDTYRVTKSATAHEVILKLLQGFENRIGESYRAQGKDAYQKLILASIVEREERVDANQPIVAGILEKRVREGIAMGADATVCVGYGKTQKECTPTFVATVINQKNPYNTRNTLGYPPTPIASVPISAWGAATNPETSPYYYYLHDSDGVIHYGRTNDEHVANKRKYLQ